MAKYKYVREDIKKSGETFVRVYDGKSGAYLTRFFAGPDATDEQVGAAITSWEIPDAVLPTPEPILSEVELERDSGGKTFARIAVDKQSAITESRADRGGVERGED